MPRRRLPGGCLSFVLAAVLLISPALAQRAGCGFGSALERLGEADRMLAAVPESLPAGRTAGTAAGSSLRQATATLAGCGCHQAADHATEAAGLAEQATAEANLARVRGALDRARFSLRLARERLGRQGCS